MVVNDVRENTNPDGGTRAAPTETTPARQPIDDFATTAVYLSLIAYLLASSLFIRVERPVQVAYAICVLVVIGVPVVLALDGRRVDRRTARIVSAAAGISCLYLVIALVFNAGRTPLHMAVDFSTTMMPLGFLLIGTLAPEVFRRIVRPGWILAFCAAVFVAPAIVQDATGARAFESPGVGVIAIVAASAMLRDPGLLQIVSGGLLAALTGLAFLSLSRSGAVLALLAFLVSTTTSRATRIVAVVVVLVGLSYVAVAPQPASDTLRRSINLPLVRLARLLSPAEDVATLGRANEAGLVAYDMGSRAPIWWLVGRGHGASFKPAEWPRQWNISPDGYVHNIHIGIVLLWFRYGILGAALYVFLALQSARMLFRTLRRPRTADSIVRLAFSLGLGLFLVEFLVRNVLPNPMFSFFLAGFVALSLEELAAPDAVGASDVEREGTYAS